MLNPLARSPALATTLLGVMAVATAFVAPLGFAATLPMVGVVRTAAGGPVPDGKYILITSMYDAIDAAKPVWDEVQKSVEISGGLFSVNLGADKVLADELLASEKPLWLGVQVGAEPELTRVAIGTVPRAVYAKIAGSATFPYAASTSPGGKATGLLCSGCVTGDLIAAATIQAAHVAFGYAAADQKAGVANEAKHALVADGAKSADKAQSADELSCVGCVTSKHLDASVVNSFLSTKGGTVQGALKVEKGLDLVGSSLTAATLVLPALAPGDVTKAPCTAKEAGQISANLDASALYYCTGLGWKKFKLCGGVCLAPAQVNCGLAVTDDCGDLGKCSGKGTLCGVDEACKADKCVTVLGAQGTPALRCKDILAKDPAAKDGLFWIDPNGGDKGDAFQVWCRMTGEYAGAAVVIRRPGSVAGQENVAGDLNAPCNPNAGGYCKLSDAKINAIRQTSDDMDAYIVQSYKDAGVTPFCKSFAAKTCQWVSDAAAGVGCNNAVKRNSGQYCSRLQTTTSYRGMDGHTCANLNYPGVTSPGNPFVIFEHAGGVHYCGGWDTTWDRIELLVQ